MSDDSNKSTSLEVGERSAPEVGESALSKRAKKRKKKHKGLSKRQGVNQTLRDLAASAARNGKSTIGDIIPPHVLERLLKMAKPSLDAYSDGYTQIPTDLVK
jgi:hypothetical protein